MFIPLLFMGGIIGRLFREFAVTVSVAVVASAAISLTLTPVLCSLFLKEQGLHQAGWFNRALEGGFNWMLRWYDRGLNFVFRHQLPTLLSTLALIVLTGYLYVTIPKGFFPEQDTGFIFGQADAREDISYYGMAKLTQQIVDIVRRDPDVSGVFSFTGATAYNPTENTARIFIQLVPHNQRSLTSNQIIQRLRPKVAAVQGIRFFMQSGQDISIGGRLSRTLYQYTLTDTDPDELNHWAPILERAMKKLPELQDVASDQQVAAPHIGVQIDRDAASRMGVSPSLIDATLYDAFGQRQVATMYTSKNQYKVILEVEPQFQDDPTALSKIYVAGPNGAQIPISAFAHFTSKIESLSVNHQGQFPAVTLSFNLAPGVALGQAVDKIQALTADLRVPGTLDGSFQGTAQAFQASLSSTPLLVAAAILVVYIVLGVLYESYIHPITILSALPSAGVGALLALKILHYDLSVIAMIGIILLDRHRQKERDHDDRLRAPGGADRGQEPARGDPSGVSVALPADHDDDIRRAVRRVADRAWPGCGIGIAAAARHRDRRRAARVAVAHPLHHADHLPLPRALRALGRPAVPAVAHGGRRWRARAGRCSRESARALSNRDDRRHARTARIETHAPRALITDRNSLNHEQALMSISEPFIRRPIATSLLMLGVLVFGIGAYNLLPVAPVPNVDFPTITVTAQYPGADPQTMASAVATPLEQQFTSIPSLSQMTSWSGVGVDLDHAAIRPDPQHRCRGGRTCAGDQCRERRVAAETCRAPPTYRKGEPGGFCRS